MLHWSCPRSGSTASQGRSDHFVNVTMSPLRTRNMSQRGSRSASSARGSMLVRRLRRFARVSRPRFGRPPARQGTSESRSGQARVRSRRTSWCESHDRSTNVLPGDTRTASMPCAPCGGARGNRGAAACEQLGGGIGVWVNGRTWRSAGAAGSIAKHGRPATIGSHATGSGTTGAYQWLSRAKARNGDKQIRSPWEPRRFDRVGRVGRVGRFGSLAFIECARALIQGPWEIPNTSGSLEYRIQRSFVARRESRCRGGGVRESP